MYYIFSPFPPCLMFSFHVIVRKSGDGIISGIKLLLGLEFLALKTTFNMKVGKTDIMIKLLSMSHSSSQVAHI